MTPQSLEKTPKHQFQVVFQNVLTRMNDRCVSATLGTRSISYKQDENGFGVINLALYDDPDGEIQAFIHEIKTGDEPWLDLNVLKRKCDHIGYRVRFEDLTIQEHALGFDYVPDQGSDVAVHLLKILFVRSTLTLGKDIE